MVHKRGHKNALKTKSTSAANQIAIWANIGILDGHKEMTCNHSDNLRNLHPRLQVLYATLKSAPVIEHGPVEVAEVGNFHIWVSRGQMRRALLILDAIVKGTEARGATFALGKMDKNHLAAHFPDGMVEFQIAEKMKHESVKVSSTPIGSGFYHQYEHRYKPTGTLTFSIRDYYPEGMRKNWSDGVRQRVEDKVADIVDQICKYPMFAKEQKQKFEVECAERNRIWHEAYLRRSAPERLEKMKAELKQQIEEQGAAWQKAKAMREFLFACNQAFQTSGNTSLQAWQTQWLDWGKEWVDGFDPLTNDFFPKLKREFEELEELEAFVAQLNEEKSKEATASASTKARP
jgi:hypothetical protein